MRPSHPFVLDGCRPQAARLICVLALGVGGSAVALAQEHVTAPTVGVAAARKPAAAATTATTAREIGEQVREAVDSGTLTKKRLTLVMNGKDDMLPVLGGASAGARPAAAESAATAQAHAPTAAATAPSAAMHVPPGAIANPVASRQTIRAKAVALTGHTLAESAAPAHLGEAHWSYEGSTGPQAWGQLKPDFNLCAAGRRQSPINIDESATLRGPAEPIHFDYPASSATVVNNGHTIQVDVVGDNAITVRGSTFKLLQFHFHHPSEERVNYQGFPMVAHLVHRNAEGQLAVVAVLLESGAANPVVHKVWTHMPLDAGDRVRMPAGSVEMGELLPKDQRYYQFMGSLTTPPCSEGVLWLVLKQPVTVSREQLRMFAQLFPNNARPVQAMNGRAVRDAQ